MLIIATMGELKRNTNMGTAACDVVVLMAVYNGENYLREQLDSIKAQTYTNWRLVVRDDDSSDSTASIIREYAANDARISYVIGASNVGVVENFNRLLCDFGQEGRYVMFADQDDIWSPDKIEVTLAAMKREEARSSGALLVYCNRFVADFAGNAFDMVRLPPSDKLRQILCQNHIYGCTMMLNQALVAECAPFPRFVHTHDYWVALVAAQRGRICRIDEPHMRYRIHDSNVTGGTGNYSIVKKVINLRTTNISVKLDMLQNYLFCKGDAAACQNEMKEYVAMLDAPRCKRLGLARRFGMKAESRLATWRMYWNVFSFTSSEQRG